MAKKIGIYGASTGENSFGVGKSYLSFISKFGVPRILTPDNMYDESIDMLLLQGGADLSPNSYGAIPNYYTGYTDPMKQHVLDNCLENYVKTGMPILGICLGHQQLAAYFGSVITQHLPFHPTSTDRGKKAHDAIAENKTFYTGPDKFDVNSFHHQCIVRRDLSNELVITAFADNEEHRTSPEMQIVEAFIHRDIPVAGVQWHPEDMNSQFIYQLMYHLLED